MHLLDSNRLAKLVGIIGIQIAETDLIASSLEHQLVNLKERLQLKQVFSRYSDVAQKSLN